MTALDIVIDTSDNQPKIDWPKVYASGIRIAFVKILEYPAHGYASGPVQMAGARKAGLLAVPYGFLRAVDPKAYVREFIARCDLAPGMAYCLDWEGRASQTCAAQVAEEIGEELALIAKRKPIGYWGRPGSTPAAPTAKMNTWERWVPRYPVVGINKFSALSLSPRTDPQKWWGDPKGLPRFGQYTAWGRVPGITSVVDRSVAFFADEVAALAWVKGSPAQV